MGATVKTRQAIVAACTLGVMVAAAGVVLHLSGWSAVVHARLVGRKTVADRVEQYGPSARGRLEPHFVRSGVMYSPARVILVGLKHERRLEVWASGDDGAMRHITDYSILAASGGPWPKLRRGDNQVPEGVYGIESLNPNSRFHLSLRVDYPNERDVAQAAIDARHDLGSDIMIHGKAMSAGCLAVGDPAVEELFVLAADTGIENITLILAPHDLRRQPPPETEHPWVNAVYATLADRLQPLVRDPRPGQD